MKKIIFKFFLISLFTCLCFFSIDKVYAYTSGVQLYYGTSLNSSDLLSLNQGSSFSLSDNKKLFTRFAYTTNYVTSYSNMYQLYVRQTFCSVNGLATDDYSNVNIVNTKVRCQRSEGFYGYLSFVILNLNYASYFNVFPDEERKLLTYSISRDYTLKSTSSDYDYAVLYGMEVSPDYSSFPTYDDSSEILDKLDTLNSQLSALKTSSDEQVYYLKKIYDLFKCKEVNLINPNLPVDSETRDGITLTNNGDGTYTVKGTATKTIGIDLTKQNVIKLKGNTYYTNSIEVLSGKMDGFITVSVKGKDDVTKFNYINLTPSNYINTVKTKEDLTVVRYNYFIESGKTVDFTFRVQLEKGTSATSYLPYGQCRSMMDTITESANKSAQNSEHIKNSLNDSDTSESTSTAGDFFSGFTTDTHGLTSIITAPLGLIGSITSSSCSPLAFKVPFLNNQTMELPCMSTIYKKHFGSFFTIYQTITFGIISYWVCVRIFALVKDFKNPEHDEVEVMDL